MVYCKCIVSVGLFLFEGGIYSMRQPYNTALYMRLSRDDETYGDSISIETQRTILQNYAKEHGFTNASEYIDLSRFGRDYLVVGNYTDLLPLTTVLTAPDRRTLTALIPHSKR